MKKLYEIMKEQICNDAEEGDDLTMFVPCHDTPLFKSRAKAELMVTSLAKVILDGEVEFTHNQFEARRKFKPVAESILSGTTETDDYVIETTKRLALYKQCKITFKNKELFNSVKDAGLFQGMTSDSMTVYISDFCLEYFKKEDCLKEPEHDINEFIGLFRIFEREVDEEE